MIRTLSTAIIYVFIIFRMMAIASAEMSNQAVTIIKAQNIPENLKTLYIYATDPSEVVWKMLAIICCLFLSVVFWQQHYNQ